MSKASVLNPQPHMVNKGPWDLAAEEMLRVDPLGSYRCLEILERHGLITLRTPEGSQCSIHNIKDPLQAMFARFPEAADDRRK